MCGWESIIDSYTISEARSRARARVKLIRRLREAHKASWEEVHQDRKSVGWPWLSTRP